MKTYNISNLIKNKMKKKRNEDKIFFAILKQNSLYTYIHTLYSILKRKHVKPIRNLSDPKKCVFCPVNC